MEYKETLNLPKTDFPMKGNLPHREPEILKKWDEKSIYHRNLEQSENKKQYILHDGPPYANGDIHIGHAVNKILKDFIIKSKIMSGYHVPFIPGWDCHGLPIELQVEKKYGKAKFRDNPKGFILACREFAEKQIKKQKEDFIRLGIFGTWDKPYTSMDKEIESEIVNSLSKMIKNGHIYYGSKPVHWCIESSSALAEAEVEYKDITSHAVCVNFKVLNKKDISLHEKLDKDFDVYIPIWTTTPWTLPANRAVALSSSIDYSFVKIKDRYLILAKNLIASVMDKSNISNYEILFSIDNEDFSKLELQHPFYDFKVPAIIADHVTDENGTGAVHIAPGHGTDDYLAGKKYNLEIYNPVDDYGRFYESLPIFGGKKIRECNDEIIELLKENKSLLFSENYEHSYPHCWRYKTPLIFRATPQWFMSMDNSGLRKSIQKEIPIINWLPSWGQDRIFNMIEGRPDWCLSRQRNWGVPLPLFLHKESNELHPDTQTILNKASEIIKNGNIEAWIDYDKKLLVKDIESYTEVKDTLDVWFDSGVTHQSVLKNRGIEETADLYLEGSDQHRGWFQSSLITSHAMYGKSPYKNVLTHGFVVDKDGQKMSKSIGNIISPQKIIKDKGADILRLWVAMTDYSKEMTISDEIIKRVSESYRRIRNTSKFLLSNISDYDGTEFDLDNIVQIDKWIIHKAKKLNIQIQKDYSEFKFHKLIQDIINFCTLELGGYYLDIIKDRLYTSKSDGLSRRSAQKTCHILISYLNSWIAPILTFTAEEIYSKMPNAKDSIYLTEWFDIDFSMDDHEIDIYDSLYSIKPFVSRMIEEARNDNKVGSSLECKLDLICNDKLYQNINNISDELKFVFIVSECTLRLGNENDSYSIDKNPYKLSISISKSQNNKCERCWHLNETVGTIEDHPTICRRCSDNVYGDGECRKFA
ncbi:MAG: isoleucine--tRNA ligase [Gammaproteobacteria bacterium]|nr:isoleucine--tRNA ligase [Gammaproteobacteria bacterium]